MAAKLAISVRNTLTLTTLSIEDPAADRMARMLAMQAAVLSAILAEVGRSSPEEVAGN